MKRIFPQAEDISEDWNAGTVAFKIVNSGGSLTLNVDNSVRDGLASTFGSASMSITACPDTRYANDSDYDHMIGVILKIILLPYIFAQV